MDRHSGCAAAKDTGVERHVLAKKALRFLALVSFFSFLYSYFLGFSSYNFQFSTLIFSLFAHSLDRKFMFLICNGIVAFLVKNLSLGSSAGLIKNAAEDGDKQISELPATLVQENVASVEYDITAVAEEEEEEEETEECTYRAVSEPTGYGPKWALLQLLFIHDNSSHLSGGLLSNKFEINGPVFDQEERERSRSHRFSSLCTRHCRRSVVHFTLNPFENGW